MRIVVALGGNALLPRGSVLSAAAMQRAVARAATVLAGAIATGHQLVITHGNGPQVGLLALQSAAGPAASALPFDVLGAESEGWIGYAIELALRNALPPGAAIVTLITQTLVDATDPAFTHPSKPIGPVYDEATARALAKTNGWAIAPDGAMWRRVAASPAPLNILEIDSIQHLSASGTTVICAGGGGVPVAKDADGTIKGVEAVIDKDATSALLAVQAHADMLVLLTDVSAVAVDFGKPTQRLIAEASPKTLADYNTEFQAGSMGPKVAAVCRFVTDTGRQAAIGNLYELSNILAGHAGTRIMPDIADIKFYASP